MQSLAALADPTRRKIVELPAERERTAGELVAAFKISAPAISQHLNVLREAGLVSSRAEGSSSPPAIATPARSLAEPLMASMVFIEDNNFHQCVVS